VVEAVFVLRLKDPSEDDCQLQAQQLTPPYQSPCQERQQSPNWCPRKRSERGGPYHAWRAQMGSISVTMTTAPIAFKDWQHPRPTFNKAKSFC